MHSTRKGQLMKALTKDVASAAVSAPAIALRDVRKVHGEGEGAVVALDGISIELPAGSFTAIMGPSGSLITGEAFAAIAECRAAACGGVARRRRRPVRSAMPRRPPRAAPHYLRRVLRRHVGQGVSVGTLARSCGWGGRPPIQRA
jgi:hypothetical protein